MASVPDAASAVPSSKPKTALPKSFVWRLSLFTTANATWETITDLNALGTARPRPSKIRPISSPASSIISSLLGRPMMKPSLLNLRLLTTNANSINSSLLQNKWVTHSLRSLHDIPVPQEGNSQNDTPRVSQLVQRLTPRGAAESSVVERIVEACPASEYHGKNVLMIVPDGTRTAPVGLLFHTLHEHLGPVTKALDVMVALGTHPPMSEEAICQRLEISESDRHSRYSRVQFFNHEWHNSTALKRIGVIAAEEIRELSGGLFSRDVPVEVNKRVFDYDRILIVGPVFPHEVVGFSGGNKYLFPGISGPELLNFFHWLGAVITTPRIIGSKWTPVRKIVDRAAAMLEIEKICIAMVVRPDESLAGLFIGTPEQAWDEASELSKKVHIAY